MESDLPLIEIAEEDDSLLQLSQDLHQTPSKSSLDYFNFSPFSLPPSHAKNLRDRLCMEKPSSSSSEVIHNKENVYPSSVELPKMGMEPMQMKRRKKVGGYDLRKSLAWDRAFFTDEGILDPRELTLITGIDANTCRGGLPTIREEGSSSCYTDIRGTCESNDMEASEEAKIEVSRDDNHTTKRNRENTGCSMRNHDSLLHNKVTHKVLSSNHTNRGRSKAGGSPLASSSSSSKRSVCSNTLNTQKTESNIPKLRISKPGSCSYLTIKSSMVASQPRHNLISKPTTNSGKNFGVKSSSQKVHGSQSKAKTGSGNLHLPVKEQKLTQKTVKNLTHASKAASSTRSRLLQVDRANSGSKKVPNKSQLCKIQDKSAPLAAKHPAKHAAENSNNSLPEAARSTSSGPVHVQSASKGLIISDRCESQECPAAHARPSGLRLPSPSLDLFDKRTTYGSGYLQPKKSQQARPSAESNGVTENICSGVLTSSKECCTPSPRLSPSLSYMLNTSIKRAPHSNIYQNLVTAFQYQEANVSIGVDDRAQTLWEQSNTVKSDDVSPKVNRESHFFGGSQLFMESPGQDISRKRENDVGTTKFVPSVIKEGIAPYNFALQLSASRIMPAESSCLEEGTLPNATDISDHLSQEKRVSNAIHMDLAGQKQGGVDVDLIPRAVTSSGDDALVKTELVLQAAQCTSTYPQSLEEEERLDTAAPTVKAQRKIHKENHKSRELGTMVVAETCGGSLDNTLDAKPTVQGFTGGSKTYSHFQSENQTIESSRTVSNISKSNVEDGHVELLDGDELVESSEGHNHQKATLDAKPTVEGSGTASNIFKTDVEVGQVQLLDGDVLPHFSERENHSIEKSDHSDMFGKQVRISNAGIILERVSKTNHEYAQEEPVCKAVWNDAEENDVYECDPVPSTTVVVDATLLVVKEAGNRDGESEIDSKLEPAVEERMVVENSTCMEYCSAGKEPCSSLTDSLLVEKTTLIFDDRVLITDGSLSTETILDSVVIVPEKNTNASAQILPMVQVNGDDQPHGLVKIMPSVEENNCSTNGLDSITTHMIRAEGSKISIEEQVEETTMVDEFQDKMDDPNDHKDATVLCKRSNSIKRQDNTLVIHPPNAVPFSDEWLAAIEAAGEEILTMKCGAVQHSPPDKSVPPPGPWSPVKKKANEIGPYDCTKYTNANAMPSNSQLPDL